VCAAVSARGLSQPPRSHLVAGLEWPPPSPERSLSERLAQSQSAGRSSDYVGWVLFAFVRT
jgi:hypothetical protein